MYVHDYQIVIVSETFLAVALQHIGLILKFVRGKLIAFSNSKLVKSNQILKN